MSAERDDYYMTVGLENAQFMLTVPCTCSWWRRLLRRPCPEMREALASFSHTEEDVERTVEAAE